MKPEIRAHLRGSDLELVSKLISIQRAGDAISDTTRKAMALEAVLGHLNDIPVLNDSGELLQPLYAIRDDLLPNRGPNQNGKSDGMYRVTIFGAAASIALKALGKTFTEADLEVEAILEGLGCPKASSTIKTWRTGEGRFQRSDGIQQALTAIENYEPLTVEPLKPVEKVHRWLRQNAGSFSRGIGK